MSINLTMIALVGLLSLLGCAPKGTSPHDMSQAAHEAEAARHEEAAAAELRAYNPDAEVTVVQCRAWSTRGYRTCWTSVVNPTEEHLRAAERARAEAEAHRAASTALGTAEAAACRGIPAADRDMSPFEHREDIVSVEPHMRPPRGGKGGSAPTVNGATVTFLAVPGMTAEWLQRVVDCHLARNAALGHVVPEMPDCPLVPKGAEAKVRSTGNGFAVTVKSDDEDAGRDILARARRLVPAMAEATQ